MTHEQPLSLEVCKKGWNDAPVEFRQRLLELFPHMINGAETNYPPHLQDFIDFCLQRFRAVVEKFLNTGEIEIEAAVDVTSGFTLECIDRGIHNPTAV